MTSFVRTRIFGKATRMLSIVLIGVFPAFSQTSEGKARNNPYSPSPTIKVKPPEPKAPQQKDVSFVMNGAGPAVRDNSRPLVDIRPSIAQATFNIAKAAEAKTLSPTEFYKIGIGDVLYITVRNVQTGSGYYTVRTDGTIDFPLAGANVVVADHTLESVEELIASGITIFKDATVEVKVRQYASHRITVSGLVENGGEKFLQREAMPLFAIKAEAGVSSRASKVSVVRGPGQKAEVHDLNEPRTDDILIFPGSAVEFLEGTSHATGVYFISGAVVAGGQKDLSNGLTLYQAVIVAGGSKGDPKKATIRRKNEKGMFNNLEFNLRSIKEGKLMDPILAAGDIVEIRN